MIDDAIDGETENQPEVDVLEDEGAEDEGAEDDVADEAEEEAVDGEPESAAVPEKEDRAPEWVRELRRKSREDQKRIRELEARLNAPNEPSPLGQKPTLEGCDYDTDKFEADLTAWHDRKRQIDAEADKARQAEDEAKSAWQKRLDGYVQAKSAISVEDFDDAEWAVQERLSPTQIGIIIKGVADSARFVYELGRNGDKLKQIASITDPVDFAFAVAKMEERVKANNRKPPPAPEKLVQGHASSGSVDSTLARLRAEAEKTGDYTKVTQYKRQKSK